MELRFEPNLEHQKGAINSVVSIFDGALKMEAESRIFGEVSPNVLRLSDQQIALNKQSLYKLNNIDDPRDIDELDFSIEMETGTGKTYVYLRTIFELYKVYGMAKFIIVTPSLAVKEGVLTTLKDAEKHFFELYSTRAAYFEYNSKRAKTDLRNFAETNQLTIMVTNTQAFTGDTKIINAEGRDDTHGIKLSDLVAKIRPIIILDEPQEGMDASKTGEAIARFRPLFKLRYSATHSVVKNLIYRLTPYDAYNQGLVKKIEVLSVVEDNTESNAHIVFKDIKIGSGLPQVKLELQARVADNFKLKTFTVKDDQDLRSITGNPVYTGWIVERIAGGLSGGWKIRFTNGRELSLHERIGWDKTAVFTQQLRWTIKKHFEKKKRLEAYGIKVLSLCFIDRVDNFIHPDSLIRVLFEKIYTEEYIKLHGFGPSDIESVYAGYFSRASNGEFTDNESSMNKNKEIYDEILKNKKLLLDLNNPREFIFSHSALGVGWDNPNIFQICTLNETQSIIKKRQEIGRGLRICVNQRGERIRDTENVQEGEEVNLLTVVANQSYEAFVSDYQNDLRHDYGLNVVDGALPRNALRQRKEVNLKPEVLESDDFKELWRQIESKTRCSILFDEDQLAERCISALNKLHISQPQIRLGLNQISSISSSEISGKLLGTETVELNSSGESFDIVDEISEATSISHLTLRKILIGVQDKTKIVINPADFIQKAISSINKVLSEQLVRFVRYEPISEKYSIAEFKEIEKTYKEIVAVERGVYDSIIKDSDLEGEFAHELDETQQVKLFLKLPSWYKIPLPGGGSYNPDWAAIIQKKFLDKTDSKQYCFVIETKGKTDIDLLDPEEQFKIRCAIKHFEAVGLETFVAPVKPRANFKEEVNRKVTGLL